MGVNTPNGRLHTELHTLGVWSEKQVRAAYVGRENLLGDGLEGVHPGC
jgi:hypothetical protein